MEAQIIKIRYRDHIIYNRGNPLAMKPQVREAVGWLVYECADYIVLCWDRTIDPSTLKRAPQANGLVLLRAEILELRRIG
ncbi:MAG TPA: hypothetical protein VK487_07265 [Candidatus Bathyarchaeia archaeon]|nr:hypothetical protein [Candidatus Bathyarchaeia archaeon]